MSRSEKEKMSINVYCGLLKMFDDFSYSNYDVNFEYIHDHPKFTELKKKYPIEEVAGNGNDLSKAINLLSWLSKNVYHNSQYNNHIPNNSIDLLDYAYKGGKENGINCRSLSIILTECCLSIGLKARTVYILPLSPYDMDNHVVTNVYIDSINKWIMLDPTYNSYFLDQNENILSPWEARDILANQRAIITNKEIFYNDTDATFDELNKHYIEYMAKDLFYMQTTVKSTYYAERDNTIVYISPRGFDVKRRNIIHVEQKIKQQGNNKDMEKWLINVKKEEVLFINMDAFTKKPEK